MAVGAWRAGAWRVGAWRAGAWRGMGGEAPAVLIDPRYLKTGRAAWARSGVARHLAADHAAGAELAARAIAQNVAGTGRLWAADGAAVERTADGPTTSRAAPYGPERTVRYDAARAAHAPERDEGVEP